MSIVTIELTKTLGCTLDATLNRGKVYRLMRLMLSYTQRLNLIMPTFERDGKPEMPDGYEGALVLDPKPGYYDDTTVVFDFKSLYPSCIIGWNISLDCHVLDNNHGLADSDIELIEGETFVKDMSKSV